MPVTMPATSLRSLRVLRSAPEIEVKLPSIRMSSIEPAPTSMLKEMEVAVTVTPRKKMSAGSISLLKSQLFVKISRLAISSYSKAGV